jgi:hypothetical protein
MSKFLALLLALASAEDRADQSHLAAVEAAIVAESAHAPRPPGEWRALLASVGINESGFSKRIIDGHCKKHECDHGRAKGWGQLHANSTNLAEWAKQDGDIPLQTRLVSDQLKRAYYTCSRSGVPWLQGTINAYAGRRCGDTTWPGLGQRIATYGRLSR